MFDRLNSGSLPTINLPPKPSKRLKNLMSSYQFSLVLLVFLLSTISRTALKCLSYISFPVFFYLLITLFNNVSIYHCFSRFKKIKITINLYLCWMMKKYKRESILLFRVIYKYNTRVSNLIKLLSSMILEILCEVFVNQKGDTSAR